MKKRLKILNLIDIPWYSGATEYAISQAEALARYGYEIYFALPKINPAFTRITRSFKTIEISQRKEIPNPLELARILRFIRQNKIDIINAHTGRMQTLTFIISLFLPVVKIVRTKADAKDIKRTPTYSKLNAVICGSRYIERMYTNKGIKVPLIKTIYLSSKPITPKPLPPLPYKITIIGRLDPVKGHYNFIKAASEILKKRSDIRFIIAGKEENIKWSDLKKEIPNEFENYFNYLGWVDDVYDIMASSHIGVISSISSEAVSRVAIEWLNSARMVISSDVGCLGEIIDKDFIYPHNNWHSLAMMIEKNLDLEKIKYIGEKNRERFLTLFSFDRFAALTDEIFQKI